MLEGRTKHTTKIDWSISNGYEELESWRSGNEEIVGSIPDL